MSRFQILIPSCKVEAYNKIVKNEFLAVEQISSIDEGKVRYDKFVKAYNDKREHGGINGLTPSEMFLKTFSRSHTRNNTKQEGVTYVGI
ncbi:MAG: integrase core domain-containing protein [Candidatus Nitrosopolaris sp.]